MNKRRKYFVDPHVQGAILRQAGCYWLLCTVTVAMVVAIYRLVPQWISGQSLGFDAIWHHLAPTVVSSIILLPVMVFVAIRFSHRFVGPILRLRQTLRDLSQGSTEPMAPLREGDFWRDMPVEINQVAARLAKLQDGLSRSEEITKDTGSPAA